jgi:hypothetical protein
MLDVVVGGGNGGGSAEVGEKRWKKGIGLLHKIIYTSTKHKPFSVFLVTLFC